MKRLTAILATLVMLTGIASPTASAYCRENNFYRTGCVNGFYSKYGVIVVNTGTDILCIRLLYNADYDDLLPAAQSNRKTYSAYISEILKLTNKMRSEKGLPALKLSEKLTEQACVRAEEVAWSGIHGHTRPGNKSYTTLFIENGYESGAVGENLGENFDSASDVCKAWKNSESHYNNILSKRYTDIGIGVAVDPASPDGFVFVQHFYGK